MMDGGEESRLSSREVLGMSEKEEMSEKEGESDGLYRPDSSDSAPLFRNDVSSYHAIPQLDVTESKVNDWTSYTKAFFQYLNVDVWLIATEVKNRLPEYPSDWKVAVEHCRELMAPTTYIFLNSIIPALAFGQQLHDATGGSFGVKHAVCVTWIGGMVQAVFGGQPLLIVGLAEPIVVMYGFMYLLVKDNPDIGSAMFVPWCAWVNLWVSGFCILYAVLGTTRLIVFFTRFCGHIFGCLIVCLFFQQTIQGTYREFALYGPIDGMWSVVVAFLLPLTALALTQLKYADDFLTKSIRMFLSDYAAAIVVVLFTILSTALPEYGLHGLPHKVDSHQTFGDSFKVINEMLALPFSARMLAAFPGLSISILFFFDHTVSSQLAQTGDDLIVTKPSTYAYDLMLLGILTACLGLMGFPPVNGVIPQAPLHARALRGLAADHEKRTTASNKERGWSAKDVGEVTPRGRSLSMQERGGQGPQEDDDDEGPAAVPPVLSRQTSDMKQVLTSPRNPHKSTTAMTPSEIEKAQETARKLLDEKLVLEQRGSNFVQALLCGCLVPAAPITGLLPTSVLWGYFAFMAADAAMANNNLIFRLILFFRSEKSRKEIEKASWKDIDTGIIDRYTFIQLIVLFCIWSMTFWGSNFVWLGIVFPLPIVALLPLRQLLLPWLLGSDNIETLDPMSVGNAANEHGLTLLHAAAWSGNVAFVTQFLDQKHGYDTLDQKQRTPLHCACCSTSDNNIVIARLLIDAGADVNLKDNDGTTPLLIAATIGRIDLVRLLVQSGADLNLHDVEGVTPLMKAIGTGDKKMVSYLMDNGADARLVDVNGTSPLHIAAERGKESIIKLLLEKGNVDLDCVGKSGRTALHLAAKNDRIKVAKLLLEAKARLDIHDVQGKTPLHASAELKDCGIEMCDLLIKSGADPSSVAADGDTALDLMGVQKRLNFLSKWVLDHYQKKDFRKLFKLLESYHFALWFAVVKVEEPVTGKGAQEFKHLSAFVHDVTMKYGWKVAEEAKDEQGRPAFDSASKAMRDTMERVLLWHGRYKLDKKPVAEHNSPTCFVFKAVDEHHKDDKGNTQPIKVALKMMRKKASYYREVKARRQNFNADYVMDVLDYYPKERSPELASMPETVEFDIDIEEAQDRHDARIRSESIVPPPDGGGGSAASNNGVATAKKIVTASEKRRKTDSGDLTKLEAEQLFWLVMPLADRNLFVALKQEQWAGKNVTEIRHVFAQLVQCVKHMHERNVLHSDIKPLNVVRVGHQWKLIDLDAACDIGKENVGHKTSSCYVPPEAVFISNFIDTLKKKMAKKYDPKLQQLITEAEDEALNDPDCRPKIRCADIIGDLEREREYDLLVAHPSYDVWSLGCILYQMVNSELRPLFQGDRDDNITSSDEVTAEANLLSLATWRPQLLEAKLAHIGFTAESSGDSTSIFHARNLVSRMLQKDPMKRMTLQQVLTHPFLCPGKKVARLHGEQPEYDIFLSYRQATDKDHVETIFNQLQHAGLNVWWDRDSMKKGLKWEESFCAGLANSRTFVPLLSRGAINHPDINHQNFSKLTADSRCDNVFLEHRLAIELLDMGLIEAVYPIYIGDFDSSKGEYLDYWASGCHPENIPEIAVKLVEEKLREHLDRESLGTPMVDNRTVKSVLDVIGQHLGIVYKGAAGDFYDEVVDGIVEMMQTLPSHTAQPAPAITTPATSRSGRPVLRRTSTNSSSTKEGISFFSDPSMPMIPFTPRDGDGVAIDASPRSDTNSSTSGSSSAKINRGISRKGGEDGSLKGSINYSNLVGSSDSGGDSGIGLVPQSLGKRNIGLKLSTMHEETLRSSLRGSREGSPQGSSNVTPRSDTSPTRVSFTSRGSNKGEIGYAGESPAAVKNAAGGSRPHDVKEHEGVDVGGRAARSNSAAPPMPPSPIPPLLNASDRGSTFPPSPPPPRSKKPTEPIPPHVAAAGEKTGRNMPLLDLNLLNKPEREGDTHTNEDQEDQEDQEDLSVNDNRISNVKGPPDKNSAESRNFTGVVGSKTRSSIIGGDDDGSDDGDDDASDDADDGVDVDHDDNEGGPHDDDFNSDVGMADNVHVSGGSSDNHNHNPNHNHNHGSIMMTRQAVRDVVTTSAGSMVTSEIDSGVGKYDGNGNGSGDNGVVTRNGNGRVNDGNDVHLRKNSVNPTKGDNNTITPIKTPESKTLPSSSSSSSSSLFSPLPSTPISGANTGGFGTPSPSTPYNSVVASRTTRTVVLGSSTELLQAVAAMNLKKSASNSGNGGASTGSTASTPILDLLLARSRAHQNNQSPQG